ncbi:MAG TPA: peptidase M42 family protein [Firmicutes bacterium]|nr:peptidase M42 family protein [Bacillota bacterium]
MLLEELTQTFGVSGYEKGVAELIVKNIQNNVDEIRTDTLGNVITLKKGNGDCKKNIMVVSHMDEIGFSVMKITDEGFLKVKKMGGISAHTSYMNRIRFKNGVGGVIGCSEKIEKIEAADIHKLYVDIGAGFKKDAEALIKVGEPACYVGEYQRLAGNCVTAKALDDRIGCYILIETLRKSAKFYNDVYFVFSVQEEVGLVGATTASSRLNPDIGIAVDITGAFDTPDNRDGSAVLGGGAAIKVVDNLVICDEYLVAEMASCAQSNHIAYQMDVLAGGGTDAGAINKSNYGVKSGGISIPTRYGHSPHAIVNMDDVNACIELLSAFVNREFSC